MKRLPLFPCLFILLIIVLASCSSGGEVTSPATLDNPRTQTSEAHGSTTLWGVWEIVIDRNTGNVNLNTLRQADLSLNVLGFLEPPALVNLAIDFNTLVFDGPNNYIGVDVILTHPFITNEKVFTGFDVKGIVFGPVVENADGLTRYFNPDEFTGTPFGYKDGLLGAPDSDVNYPKEFNGYKYFADKISLDETVPDYFSDPINLANRGVFPEGGKIKRHYDLRFGTPNTPFMVFNYAIYASHGWPTGDPPFDLDDFNVSTANQAEPVFIETEEVLNTLTYEPESGAGSGTIELEITIFDWAKPDNPESVTIEAPGVLPLTSATFVSDLDANRRAYSVSASAEPITSADLDIIVSVETEKTYGEYYFMGLMPDYHPLYFEPIETKFIHKAPVLEIAVNLLPYDDPMDVTTAMLWSIEHGYEHNPVPDCDWTQTGTEWESNGGKGVGGDYENFMDTYLVSPEFLVPSDGNFNLYISHRYETEYSSLYDYDFCDIMVRYKDSGTWIPFASNSMTLEGTNPGWPGWSVQVYTANLTPDLVFQVGFHFFSDYLVHTYSGWFIDHIILSEETNTPPIVGAIEGQDFIGVFGTYTYHVAANDNEGDDLTYAWEIGDDDPPMYDDGPGDGNGYIDINWDANGAYTVDCKVTDDGNPSLFATSAQPMVVNVHEDPPGQGCTAKSGVPEYDYWHGADTIDSTWEDMCMMSDDYIIVQDQGNSGIWRVPSYGADPWYGSAISGYTTSNLIIQLDSDSSNHIAIAYENSPTVHIYNYLGATVTLNTTITAPADVLATCFDSNDNLWVLVNNGNREMHKYTAGTFTHDAGGTFNTGNYVYGWVWDFVIDAYDDSFFILHEDDGSGTITKGVITKYSSAGAQLDQEPDVFPNDIFDYQVGFGEADPGEADILIDNSDIDYSSCRLIIIADADDGINLHATQVVRLKAADLTEIDTPWVGEAWGITCAVISRHTNPNDPDYQGHMFVGESDDVDYIDDYMLPDGDWW